MYRKKKKIVEYQSVPIWNAPLSQNVASTAARLIVDVSVFESMVIFFAFQKPNEKCNIIRPLQWYWSEQLLPDSTGRLYSDMG